MALQNDALTEACRVIAQQLNDRHGNLYIHFIPHREKRRAEALAKMAKSEELKDYPATKAARRLLSENTHGEDAGLVGVALARENLFLGLAVRDSLLALGTVNLDRCKSLKDVRVHAWHLVWHAMDMLEYHKSPAGKTRIPRQHVSRKRTPIEMAAANLRADVFAAVMCALQGEADAAPKLAKQRGIEAMQGRLNHHPEQYPFVIAMESAAILIDELKEKPMPKKKQMDEALRAARRIGKTINNDMLNEWMSFAECAQDMAWRGYNGEQILGAAMNTSDNTEIRALSHMITEVTGIKPVSMFDLKYDYSPFATHEYNEKLHERTIDQVFDDVMREVHRQRSADPIIDVANSQNLKLQSGHVLGWCAGALQTAAQVYSDCDQGARESQAAARKEFDLERSRTAWSSLQSLNGKIVESYRSNIPVTLSTILELCQNDPNAETLRKSIEATMKDHVRQSEMELPAHKSLAAGARKDVDPAAISEEARLSATRGGDGAEA